MTCIRLETANTESARRTLEVYKPVHYVSMSHAEGKDRPSSERVAKSLAFERRVMSFKEGAEND